MRIATWNINSVRLRIQNVIRFVKEYDIDVICLQETKTQDEFFPIDDFKNIGMKHISIRGEKSYNGVAIISNIPFIKETHENFCGLGDTRHISVILKNNITLHNFYVPAGGDIPDRKTNKKFDHKIKFISEMESFFENKKNINTILVGDLNIAPHENDVWSHKQLLNVVSHTPIETTSLIKFEKSCNWIDIMRKIIPYEEKLYSWWSYRNRDWKKSDRGRRLDHIWVSKNLSDKVSKGIICKEIRDWEKPSDHVPIIMEIDLK